MHILFYSFKMAQKDDHIITLDQCSFSLIDLPNDYNKSLFKLVDHVKSIMTANEKHHGRRCEKFYIGKSTLHTWSGRHFDSHNRYTWKTELIRQRWDARRQHGYQAMAVLTVVTKDTLPPLKSRRPAQWKQQYTLALEQALITHFMFVEDDERLENETTVPGNLERSGAVAYVLYLAMKFEDARDPPAAVVPSRSETPLLNSPSTHKMVSARRCLYYHQPTPASPNVVYPGTPNTTSQTVYHSTPSPTSQTMYHSTPTTTSQTVYPGTLSTTSQAVYHGTPSTTSQAVYPGTPSGTFQTVYHGTPSTTFQAVYPGTPSSTSQLVHYGTPSTTSQAVYHGISGRDTGIKPCKCGSTTHRTTAHHECPLRRPTCQCGSTTHQRINHHDCPLNTTVYSGTANPPSQAAYLGIPSSPFQTVPPAAPSRDTPIKPCKCGSTTHRTTAHHECPLRRPTCQCGSTTHQRINHHDCPLNTTVYPGTASPPSQAAYPGIPNTTFQTVSPAAPSRDTAIKPCKCGSTTHRTTAHHECPLRRPTCQCGSTTHQRTNHHDCPLNKKK